MSKTFEPKDNGIGRRMYDLVSKNEVLEKHFKTSEMGILENRVEVCRYTCIEEMLEANPNRTFKFVKYVPYVDTYDLVDGVCYFE